MPASVGAGARRSWREGVLEAEGEAGRHVGSLHLNVVGHGVGVEGKRVLAHRFVHLTSCSLKNSPTSPLNRSRSEPSTTRSPESVSLSWASRSMAM